MNFKSVIFFLSILLFSLINSSPSYSQKINTIDVVGNDRISKDVIIMFSEVSKDQYKFNDLNSILKKIYDSNFFENVKLVPK